MKARLPREMLAAVTRKLSVSVGLNTIVEALNYASAQLAGYYAWPWLVSEITYTFPAAVTGQCMVNDDGTIEVFDPSDANFTSYVDQNWRILVGTADYPILSGAQSLMTVDMEKVVPITTTARVNCTLFQSSVTMPADFMPGKDITAYNTTMRYRIRHINRQAFERQWQSYKQMYSNMPLSFADREPFYDSTPPGRWKYQLQFCPRPVANTQIRVTYLRFPKAIDLTTNAPTEWPQGYDEVIELLAAGRIGEEHGDAKAILGAKRAKGLIRQLRGGVATAVIDDTPEQNAPYGGASWEQDGMAVLPREG